MTSPAGDPGAGRRFEADLAWLAADGFTARCRSRPADFTRRRKLPASTLALAVVARRGRSTAVEIAELDRFGLIKGGVSVAGMLKARLKLNPEAFRGLMRHHAAQVYAPDETPRLFHGRILLAVDGSNVNLPTTPETLARYGNSSGHGRDQAACSISALHDLLNRQVIDLGIHRFGFDERASLLGHLADIDEVVGDRPVIVVADRGYPSLDIFQQLHSHGVGFVIRLPTTFYPAEINQMTSDDQTVTVAYDSRRMANLRRRHPDTAQRLRDHGPVTFRVVAVTLPSGARELLATNLDPAEFTQADIAEIYRLRWGIETCFQTMKHTLQLENFSGTKPVLIAQDIYTTGYLANLVFDFANDAQDQLDQDQAARDAAGHGYKHHMTINTTFAAAAIKTDIIHLVLAPADQRPAIVDRITRAIRQHIVPVRPGRHYPRNTRPRHNRYHQTHKRAY
jgi:hypothetical protein